MLLLDGKIVSSQIKEKIKQEVDLLTSKGIKAPHLAAILVGNDPASETYVANKVKSCHELGFESSLIRFSPEISEKALLSKIDEINQDDNIDGLIVQLPLPASISVEKVIERIDPAKDADGFHPINIGKMVKNIPCLLPATPKGILEIIKYYKIETSGKNAVVLGRSQIVGTPVSILLGRKDYPGNATVTLLHSQSKDLKAWCRNAEILVVAIGSPHFVTEDMVNEGAVVIDVGMHRIPDDSKKSGFRLTGDVDFANVAEKCSAITPVPGGVGLLTIASLLSNTLEAARLRRGF